MTTTTRTDPDTGSGTLPRARRVDDLLAHYGESHRHPGNEIIHFIAIPLITVSLVGMLFALHPYAAYAFVAVSMGYYARLSVVFFVTMVLWSALIIALVFAMGSLVLPLSIAIFVGAWILQFIGHKIEGKKPSFLDDIKYLWVGPLFVVSRLLKKIGLSW